MTVDTYSARLQVGGRFAYIASEAWEFLRGISIAPVPTAEDDILVLFADPHEVWAIWVHCRASGIPLRLTAHT